MPFWSKDIFKIHEEAFHRRKKIIPWSDEDIEFLSLALAGEAGEQGNIVKKFWRGDDIPHPKVNAKLHEELCDVRVYVELLAKAVGCNLDEEIERKLPEIRAKFMQLPLEKKRD